MMERLLDYSKYPDIEQRIPREVFTEKLRKLCAKIALNPTKSLTFKAWPSGVEATANVSIAGLWVFGSYARGALTCGDLDILVAFTSDTDYLIPPGEVKGAFIGAPVGVRVYEGTPASNASGAAITDAVQLWAPGLDWQAALHSIVPDPEAGRFSRPSDQVPVRAEQHRLSLETVEELLALRESNVLSWRFIGLSELRALAVAPEALSHFDRRTYDSFCGRSAMKRKLAPLVFGLGKRLRLERGVSHAFEDLYRGLGPAQAGGIHLYAEQLHLHSTTFDALTHTAVAFFPALNVRGPNGCWLVEQGPAHPLVKAFEDMHLWVLGDREGCAGHALCSVADSESELRPVNGFYVFASKEGALEFEKEIAEGSDLSEEARQAPKLIQGTKVLELLAGADIVMAYEGPTLALTDAGAGYCRALGEPADVPSIETLPAALNQLFTDWSPAKAEGASNSGSPEP